MKLTILPADKTIGIDGIFMHDIKQDMSWIPNDIHAVQWIDDIGQIQYTDNRLNLEIHELGIYEQAIVDYNNEKQRLLDEDAERLRKIEEARDYWQELRDERNYLLEKTDWTQILDNNLTNNERELWTIYRNQLRNLPENITDPKILVLDHNHLDWPNPPQ